MICFSLTCILGQCDNDRTSVTCEEYWKWRVQSQRISTAAGLSLGGSAPRGHWAMSGFIWGWQTWQRGLLASSGEKPRMLSILWCTGEATANDFSNPKCQQCHGWETLINSLYGFSSSYVWMWELDHKESWAPMNWCFWTVVLEKTLESPLDCKEIQPVHPKGDQSGVFFGRNDAKAETPVLWPPDAKSWLTGKDSDAGRDWGQEEKGSPVATAGFSKFAGILSAALSQHHLLGFEIAPL